MAAEMNCFISAPDFSERICPAGIASVKKSGRTFPAKQEQVRF